MALKALSDSGEGMQSLYKGGLATRLLYGTQGTIGSGGGGGGGGRHPAG